MIFQSYVSMLYIQIDIRHLVWRALRNFAMANFEENVEEMVGMTREAADGDIVRRGRDGDETGCPGGPGTRLAARRRRLLVMNETAATGGVMYTDEGELEFDEDEMKGSV